MGALRRAHVKSADGVEIGNGYDTYHYSDWQLCADAEGEMVTSMLHPTKVRTCGDRACNHSEHIKEVKGLHAPVLDIDHPVRVVESSPGRCHVMIDVPMSWRKYRRLIRALAAAGVIEEAWADTVTGRRWSGVFLPGKGPKK